MMRQLTYVRLAHIFWLCHETTLVGFKPFAVFSLQD